jgi:DNA-binding NarL/FixJ family response regulator
MADGKTNQQIADELVLSVRTVERHISTIYEKLGLQGKAARVAAAGFALRQAPGRPAASLA